MNAFGESLERKVLAGIIGAIVMVVPGHHHREFLACGDEFLAGGQLREAFAQFVQLRLIDRIGAPVAVAIDVVANHQEKVGLFAGELRQGRAFQLLIIAGGHENAADDGILARQRHALRRARQA